jgi:hypothetical protein
MKKCPPGVLCIENITLTLLCIILFVLGFLVYINSSGNKVVNTAEFITVDNGVSGFSFGAKDVLLNPYDPPLRDDQFIRNDQFIGIRRPLPINVSTNIGAVDTSYRQTGIITPLNGTSKDNILPLMGRPLFTNRDKWQYYTISNQHNNVKLPISFKGRSATNDYGVDQISNGDTVYVEGYNEPFQVTVYESDTLKYLPF